MRSFYICYNGFVAGRIAAELIYRWMLDKNRPVAIASGFRGMGIHDQTVRGFQEQTKSMPLNLARICYNMDNEDIAYESTCRLLDEIPDLGAIYINSFNYRGVIHAVQERGRAGKILLITSDISSELRKLIECGIVSASIFQNQYEQGRRGLHSLYHALDTAETGEEIIAIDPQIIMSSNLSLF
jgi:ABC-type sugar transport system substrate-binding protein